MTQEILSQIFAKQQVEAQQIHNKVKDLVDTLPIGFYAHSRVNVELDPTADTSYFSPNTRTISVASRPIIRAIAKNGGNIKPEHFDALVRSHLYHELSHAMLTPKVMKPTTPINIFEDERIETLLAGYYHNVDFKAACKEQNDFDNLTPPQSAEEAFFHLCRFRLGNPNLVDEVDRIIETYQSLNWNTNSDMVCSYMNAIDDLYCACEKDFQQQKQQRNQDFQQRKQDATQRLAAKFGDADIPQEYDESAEKQEQNNEQGQQGKGQGQQGQEQNKKADGQQKPDSANSSEQGAEGHGASQPNPFNADELFNDALQALSSSTFYKQIDTILQNFNRKNKGGNSMNGYSGVFNPRSAGREDYRFFDRRSSVRGGNQFGSLHLNLYIDDSGSFRHNANAANEVIATMCEMERRYDFFSLDICLCGNRVKHCADKNNAQVRASGSTGIQDGALELIKSLQKKDTLNYNIVLYDGECNSAYEVRGHGHYKPFDINNCTLILDDSCEFNGGQDVTKAKVIYSNNYLEELHSNIIAVLQNAFR